MARSADPAVRVALIEAAAQLLATEGLDALSIRRVATEVGTSTMAVYTHFGSKDDLVHAVVREGFSRLDAELRAVAHTDDPIADLAGMGLAYRHNALANAHLYRVMFSINPLALDDPTAATRGDDVTMAAFHALVDAVQRCVDGGELRGEPGQIALQVWAAAHGAVSLELAGFLGDQGEATFVGANRNVISNLGT